ncbi:hypothetical protein QYM36_004502 [Artemia franciscana]|uniref:Uncharacterized protein n=1 Tax=Artemia franciscana TaxID=6661 RepID=A0AA88L875_ARTSF|nr:hypothetical protein QYM36_004502 [Artemia franciscana]
MGLMLRGNFAFMKDFRMVEAVEDDGIPQFMGISGDSARSVLDDDLGLSLLLMRCVPKASCPDQSNLRSELSADVLTETEANNEQRFPRGSFDSIKFKF